MVSLSSSSPHQRDKRTEWWPTVGATDTGMLSPPSGRSCFCTCAYAYGLAGTHARPLRGNSRSSTVAAGHSDGARCGSDIAQERAQEEGLWDQERVVCRENTKRCWRRCESRTTRALSTHNMRGGGSNHIPKACPVAGCAHLRRVERPGHTQIYA
jgi:hypothetical protein